MSFVRNFGRVRFAANHFAGVLLASLGVGVVSLAGCFSVADGVPPPLEKFYYPTGLAVSPGRTTLYVTNSDFDLQYSGGTVQALDLAALRQTERKLRLDLAEGAAMNPPRATAKACAAQTPALSANDNTALYPGPCSPVAVEPFVKSTMVIGAFASATTLAVRPNPCVDKKRGARLFVTVRGDPSVTYFDVTDDREISCDPSGEPLAPSSPCAEPLGCLSCGATANGERCTSSHLIGTDPTRSQRELTLPVDPYGIDVDERGESIVIAHQTEQTASLVVNRWDPDSEHGLADVPALEYTTGNVSAGPTDIAALPIPLLADENRAQVAYSPAFVVSYRSAPEFTLLRYT
ncbi:MAG TPA: hypothetical protein PK156_38245, partial [Polyangium sp.]|nr:hypothetical protein [Polyangium sp.]